MSTHDTAESIDLDELNSSGLEDNLDWLRTTLQRRVKHIQDDDLKRKDVRWIQQSLQVPASTVSDYVDHQLSEMEADHRMYNHDRVENGEDAFPDACEGCPHYGGGCPIVTQRSPQEELDRIAESVTDGAAFKREIRSLATLHDCHRIPAWITQWETRYEGLVEEGWDIYLSIEVDVGMMDSPGAEVKVDLSDDDDDGGDY